MKGMCRHPPGPDEAPFHGLRPAYSRRRWLGWGMGVGLLAAGGPWVSARAQSPPGTVLTVRGRLHQPPHGDRADFDMAALAALPQHGFSTRTPWFDPARRMDGPLMRDVLAAAGAVPGAPGAPLRLTALNDYRVDMPFDDTQRYDVLLARLLDGRPMGVRDKGPLFVIYPFDQAPALHNVVFYSRSVWQLRTIEVL